MIITMNRAEANFFDFKRAFQRKRIVGDVKDDNQWRRDQYLNLSHHNTQCNHPTPV